MFWDTKFYHPTKFDFKRIKYENVVPAVTQQQFRSKDTISHVVAWKFRGDVKRSKARLTCCIVRNVQGHVTAAKNACE